MTNTKRLILALLISLIAMATSQRDRVWSWIQPWPAWWKLLFALFAGIFGTAVLLHATGLLSTFLLIFDINFPE